MPQTSSSRTSLRPVDLARPHSISTQAVRNYEDHGVLPPAERSASGFRVYREEHRLALAAFLALVPGCGHRLAISVLQAANTREFEQILSLLGQAHRELAEDADTLRRVRFALAGLDDHDVERGMTIGDLAALLNLSPATIRAWERQGILSPERDRATRYRTYSPREVRDARMAHQLRRGGYPLAQIADLVGRVREAGGVAPLQLTLDRWQQRVRFRGRALIAGTAALDAYLALIDAPGQWTAGYPPARCAQSPSEYHAPL